MRQGEVALDGPPSDAFRSDRAGLLASTGLAAPPAARIASRLKLAGAPVDAEALLALLARRGRGDTGAPESR